MSPKRRGAPDRVPAEARRAAREDRGSTRVIEGSLDGAGLKIAVLLSRFNELIGNRLLEGALSALERRGVRPGDVLVWPTNIGWMMGPWLIFASLINRATMGIFDGGLLVAELEPQHAGVICRKRLSPSRVRRQADPMCHQG